MENWASPECPSRRSRPGEQAPSPGAARGGSRLGASREHRRAARPAASVASRLQLWMTYPLVAVGLRDSTSGATL
jgi:hypothetical protein